MLENRKEINYLEKYFFNNDEKLLFLFKNIDNRFSVFLGEKHKENTFYNNEEIQEKEFYFYYNPEFFYIVNGEETQEEVYIGEKIVFKDIANLDEIFFKDFFDTLFKCLEKNKWPNLLEALNSISDLFSVSTKKGMENKLKGYLGEMAFVYYVMNNGKIPHQLELAKKIFEYYQKTANEKHDFRFNPKLRLEVKSTSGEKMEFQMKYNQQNVIDEINLFYGFVKYNFVQKSLGMNLEQMTNEIYEKLEIEKANIPNHLFVNTKIFDFNEYYLDAKNIEVYLFNNQDLPDFSHLANEDNSVSEIKYKLNIYNFLKNKDYDELIIFNSFAQEIDKEI